MSGIVINSEMDWDMHITKLCNNAKRISSWILNVFRNRSKQVMLSLYSSLVRSRLEYCCQVWDPYKVKHINALEQIQKIFTRKIDFVKDFDYWTRLKKLGIMSLQRRRERFLIVMVWKIKNNNTPNDINLQFVTNTRNSITKAVLPPLPKTRGKILSTYENSFVIKALKLWNKLPLTLTEITNLKSFTTKLDKYLVLYPDEPPVKGYFHKTNNSLLEYKTVPLP